mmetsp:Transcript_27432/g.80689  ORF Transcript_27432/g.80689 Transcript_27432/m.80689 type:complete len:101 (+) Transcript_27432:1412-1714(+)
MHNLTSPLLPSFGGRFFYSSIRVYRIDRAIYLPPEDFIFCFESLQLLMQLFHSLDDQRDKSGVLNSFETIFSCLHETWEDFLDILGNEACLFCSVPNVCF